MQYERRTSWGAAGCVPDRPEASPSASQPIVCPYAGVLMARMRYWPWETRVLFSACIASNSM